MTDIITHYCVLQDRDVNEDIAAINKMIKDSLSQLQSKFAEMNLIEYARKIGEIEQAMEHKDAIVDAKYTIEGWKSHSRILNLEQIKR